MNLSIKSRILKSTNSREITKIESIQPLWNNYGTLCRVYLEGNAKYPSVIVKHIKIPDVKEHPKGFISSFSKQRKIKSYQIEAYWYQNYNHQIAKSSSSPTPNCLDVFDNEEELFLLMEDLQCRGYTEISYGIGWVEITSVLSWLAHFHARFLNCQPDGLWECGTYWHLGTRPEELYNIRDTELHRLASFFDARLQQCSFQTFVHGDAKLANFCFHKNHQQVAAVDFQYVGRGCGMKDIAYFVGGCLQSDESEKLESEILDFYFMVLKKALIDSDIDTRTLEQEWRSVYHMAWADFQRFLLGWSPQHRKLNNYSQRCTEQVSEQIMTEIQNTATKACIEAGKFIVNAWKEHPKNEIFSKGFTDSLAANVVTNIDMQAQKIILDILQPLIITYDLGVLAEEGDHNNSRFEKHAFFAIDPLDGTLQFVEGKSGFATSIALVLQSGQSFFGVVYDPVHKNLYQAFRGKGFFINGERIEPFPQPVRTSKITVFADRSIKRHSLFPILEKKYDIRFVGGAVMNVIHVLTNTSSCYCKPPKESLGGCAIWDLAAVSVMLEEMRGKALFFDGTPLHLNRQESIYFNDMGLVFTSIDLSYEQSITIFQT